MSRQQQEPLGVSRPAKGKQVYSEAGCSTCATQWSSSFRSDPETGCRLCNSCHCKAYRLKRKFAGLGPAGRSDGASAPSTRTRAAPQQRRRTVDRLSPSFSLPTPPGFAPLGQHLHPTGDDCLELEPGPGMLDGAHSLPPMDTPFAGLHMPVLAEIVPAPPAEMSAAAAASARMADSQRRVFSQACASPGDVLVSMHCARRAQQATPACLQRAVLGVLPRVMLQLPDDPPGLMHTMSCLIEAVVPASLADEQAADSDERQQRDSGEHRDMAAASSGAAVAVRLTLYAAAGAVACWHEGPADPTLSLAFSPTTRAPFWTSGPEGFNVHFLDPFCPQVDLFADTHKQVAAFGHEVLQRPTLSLDISGMWNAAAMTAALAPTVPDGDAQRAQPYYGSAAVAPGTAGAAGQRFAAQHADSKPRLAQGLSFGPIPSGPLTFSVDVLNTEAAGFPYFDL